MTIEIFKYLVLRSSIDIIAGFNLIEDIKKFLSAYDESDDETDELSILIQDQFGVRSIVSFDTFNEFY